VTVTFHRRVSIEVTLSPHATPLRSAHITTSACRDRRFRSKYAAQTRRNQSPQRPTCLIVGLERTAAHGLARQPCSNSLKPLHHSSPNQFPPPLPLAGRPDRTAPILVSTAILIRRRWCQVGFHRIFRPPGSPPGRNSPATPTSQSVSPATQTLPADSGFKRRSKQLRPPEHFHPAVLAKQFRSGRAAPSADPMTGHDRGRVKSKI
jgi:hypothetical protein